jgi:type IV pilus assembly protein PilY1
MIATGTKRAIRFMQAGITALLVSTPTWGDDTDIYISVGLGGNGSPPLVMLSLDYTPDLASTQCSNAWTSACFEHVGYEIFLNLDLVDENGLLEADGGGANGIADFEEHWNAESNDFMVDSYWSGATVTMHDVMRASFRILFNELEDVYLAFMVNHDDSCTGDNASGPGQLPESDRRGCSNGAYVLKGFFDPTDSNERSEMNRKLAAIPTPQGNLSHQYQLKELYFEYFRYLTGQEVHNGHLGYTSYGSSTSNKNLHSSSNLDGKGEPLSTLLAWDGSIDTGGGNPSKNATYISPFATTLESNWDCSKVFAINVLDSGSNQEDDSNAEIEASLSSGGLGLSSKDNTAAGVIAAMRDTDLASATVGLSGVEGDQGVTSYFVADDVNTKTNSFAAAGGTGTAYDLGEPQDALESLRSIFREILSVSTTFVAASVPVNVFNRVEVVDNVYLAIFQAETTPFWPGNVKKLKIKEREVTNPDTGETETILQIRDADNEVAFSADDGRIKTDALTFWTNPYGRDVLDFDADLGEVPYKDGRSVRRGGAGQMIPQYLSDNPAAANGSGTRQLYYEPSNGSTMVALNADDATATALVTPMGAADANEALHLIKWARGIDVNDEDADGSNIDARPWLLADPMHSRPLVVNYGTTGGYSTENPNIHLMFGTNDGFFHITRNTHTNGSESGEELFAFMPRSVMDNLPTLAAGNPTTPAHPYGVDGEAVSLVIDQDNDGNIEYADGDRVYAYTGLRRGGNAYYALDVSRPTTSTQPPSLLWKIEQTSGGDFDELAMTFGTPRVTRVNYDGTAINALIFTGGYNGGWSGGARVGKDASSANDNVGNAVYVVNAETGDLIWKAVSSGTASAKVAVDSGLTDSFPSTVTPFDSNGNGLADRVYVADSGGALWRVDLPEGSGTAWDINKIAQFGNKTGDDDRRFFHAPDVVKTRDDIGEYHGVVIASGNRADPKETVVDNYLYMFKDRVLVSGATPSLAIDETDGSSANDLTDITDACITGEETTGCESADMPRGWKLALEDPGEKGLAPPLTADGVIYATSYLPEGGPEAGSCAPSEGAGRLYAVSLKDGSAVMNLNSTISGLDKADRYTEIGPGIPPGAKPLGDYVLLPGTGIDGNQIIPTGGRSRWKIYWRETDVDEI